MSQYEIASRTFKHAPTITRILDNLCKQDFLIRKMDVEDRRRFNVDLTDKGRTKVIDLLPTVKVFRKQAWNGLTNEEFKSLKSILCFFQMNGKMNELEIKYQVKQIKKLIAENRLDTAIDCAVELGSKTENEELENHMIVISNEYFHLKELQRKGTHLKNNEIRNDFLFRFLATIDQVKRYYI